MPVMVAPMSYGALSRSATYAIAMGSAMSDIAENTGEGCMSNAQRDAAKLLGVGAVAVVQGVAMGIAAGGELAGGTLVFNNNYDDEDRASGIANLLRANSGEIFMMARCTGKTVLQNIEPEDLRAITLVTSKDTGIPMAGTTRHGVDQPAFATIRTGRFSPHPDLLPSRGEGTFRHTPPIQNKKID